MIVARMNRLAVAGQIAKNRHLNRYGAPDVE